MLSSAATYNMDSVNSHLGMLVFPITFLTESLAPEMYYIYIFAACFQLHILRIGVGAPI